MMEVYFSMFGLMFVLYLSMSWFFSVIFMVFWFVYIIIFFSYEFESFHLYYSGVGGDLMSLGLVILSLWVLMLMVFSSCLSSWSNYLFFLFLIIFFILMLCFYMINFLGFYLMFEFVLIPTLFLVAGWGYQPERLGAGLYLLFYTVFCSVPLLTLILWEGKEFGLMMMVGYWEGDFNFSVEVYLLMVVSIISFLVKIPLFGLHLWLPSAHVEAPVSGSMILAGVLLSLGGYGLVRFVYYWWWMFYGVGLFFVLFSLFGGVVMSFVCLRQVDLSALIAYSSVVHMGVVVGGVMSGFTLGLVGGYVMMVGHGLCSSGLFYYVGVMYERLGSRSLMLNSGLILLLPGSVIFWFLLVSSNMAFPPSLSLLGEVFLIGSMLSLTEVLIYVIFFVSFFGGVYCLYLYSWVQHGLVADSLSGVLEISFLEMFVVVMHWVPLNLIFLSGDLFFI